MKYAKHGTMVLMLAFIVGFGTPRATAQQAYNGSFNLPAEAYWGRTLLAPGHYTIKMSLDPTQSVRLVRLEGDDLRIYILTGPPTVEQVSDRSSLRLENINGVYVVRHLDAGILGQYYTFAVSKKAHMKVERASAPSQMSVPVTTGGSD